MIEISKTVHFAAAHRVNREWAMGCRRLHGHNYSLTVTIRGEIGAVEGAPDCLVPYGDFGARIKRAVRLDNANLNEILDCPTAENLAVWAWKRLVGAFPPGVELAEVQVSETPDSSCVYRGPTAEEVER